GGTGYLGYASGTPHGLANQGWKDSWDAIRNADGSLARPPIALVEVQGYVYRALVGIADLYDRDGDGERARELRADAEDLRRRFNRDFWVDELGSYALALQGGGSPVAVVSSNTGQALWTGIVDLDHAASVEATLASEAMFSGWGIRTLSSETRGYNP